MKRLGVSLAAAVLLFGCNSEPESGPDEALNSETNSVDDQATEPVDVRVDIPEANPAFIDIVTPEVEIAAGEEKMYCLHLTQEEDAVVDHLDTSQGRYGHHVVMLSTLDPQPAGTLEDCTSDSDMWKYRAFILPGIELPERHGIEIPAGTEYVLQFHYVNASSEPILVRDVARLRTIDRESVDHWTTTFTTNSLRLDVPANDEATESFDCVLEEDVELMVLGGHLHEQGASFELLVGPDGETLESVYLVDPWVPDFRDAPPVTILFEEPMALEAGSIIRTNCAWDNPHDEALEFPAEMCSGFGYVRGATSPVHCEADGATE